MVNEHSTVDKKMQFYKVLAHFFMQQGTTFGKIFITHAAEKVAFSFLFWKLQNRYFIIFFNFCFKVIQLDIIIDDMK